MICLIFSPKRLIFLSGQTRKKVYLFHDILMKTRLAVVRDNPVHSEFQLDHTRRSKEFGVY